MPNANYLTPFKTPCTVLKKPDFIQRNAFQGIFSCFNFLAEKKVVIPMKEVG